MLELVVANRGVTAIPSWLVDDFMRDGMPIQKVKIGQKGIHKKLWVGIRDEDPKPYLEAFLEMAKKKMP